MTRGHKVRAAACALAAVALLALALSATAGAGLLEPRGKKVWFGVSDTGDPADFGEFSTAVSKHPAVIESFRTWGSDFPDSIQRWQTARARPMIHITTADNNDGHEIITPRAIAQGDGDEYLVRLNRLFCEKDMRAYVRPLGEPNRCLNVYASYDCGGDARDAAHNPRWYKLAFRRIYVIVHGGGKAKEINRRLAEAGLPPLTISVGGLPKAPVAIVWSPLPAGSPTVPQNRPAPLLPGLEAGSTGSAPTSTPPIPNGSRSTGLYNRYAGEKPFALTEWGVEAGDDPELRQPPLRLGEDSTRAARCSSTTRTSAAPAATGSRTTRPASRCSRPACTRRLFPSYAPGAPQPTAAAPGWGRDAAALAPGSLRPLPLRLRRSLRLRSGLNGSSAVMLE